MAVATVVYSPTTIAGHVKGKWTCHSSPSATDIYIGFIPSVLMWWNVSDKDVIGIWSPAMADATGISIAAAAAAIASAGITPFTRITTPASSGVTAVVGGTGFTIGTDANVQEASDVFEFIAFR